MSATPFSIADHRRVLRVLLLEPSADDARMVRDLLAGQPEFRVAAARSLEEARTLLEDGTFDAALVESALWSEAGAVLLQSVREHRPDVAIVVLTSGENEREALPALKLGAHDFVSKRNLDGEQLHARLFVAVEESRTLRRRDTMVRWLEREARTDHLTGLYNRRTFDDRLREICSAARKEQQPVALILVNVVGTRQVNEAHGHEAGDLLIRRAAQGITRCIRAIDVAARVGGDDFGVILPGGDLDLGRRIARRIAHEIERMNVDEWAREIPVSVVFGVASGVGPDPTALFTAGDQQISGLPQRLLPTHFPERDDPGGPSVA
jgi:diguanylate cyclase (GGDEF)-like protein